MDVQGRRMTVVGLGRSGLAAAQLLHALGATVRVTELVDRDPQRTHAALLRAQGITVEMGGHTKGFIQGQEMIVVSPGVEESSPPLVWAKEAGIPIIAEVELGALVCPGQIIAVTGTNGKSTVTTLIGEILQKAGRATSVCGNIGVPLCDAVRTMTKETMVCLELSSFQLQYIRRLRPKIALFTNLSQNHLDRHQDLADYARMKQRIFLNQDASDWAILNDDDPWVRSSRPQLHAQVRSFSASRPVEGAFVSKGTIVMQQGRERISVCAVDRLRILGEHNVLNALAATCAATLCQVEPRIIAHVLQEFRGLEHRFEWMGEIRGIQFINDSKATTTAAARYAIESCTGPVILIAGGRDKGSDFTVMRTVLGERVKTVILMGEAKGQMRRAWEGVAPLAEAGGMAEAVRIAFQSGEKGDCVLLAPMCTSFDMFRDFEERGQAFKQAVWELKAQCVALGSSSSP